MNKSYAEFDRFSREYDELLKDPVRDLFSPGSGEFFHRRKRDLIREYFLRRRLDTRPLSYLDVGCGKGELVSMLRSDFARVAGCDLSEAMLAVGGLNAKGIEARTHKQPDQIPFADGEFDFVTAICVYHHVLPTARPALLREMLRVVKKNGTLAIIEHNPYNPVTQLIVSRTPIDADAILLRPAETVRLFEAAGVAVEDTRYFLYLPESAYRRFSRVERMLSRVPLGGQYAIFGRSVPTDDAFHGQSMSSQ